MQYQQLRNDTGGGPTGWMDFVSCCLEAASDASNAAAFVEMTGDGGAAVAAAMAAAGHVHGACGHATVLLPTSLGYSSLVGLLAVTPGLEGAPVAVAGRRSVGLAGLLLVVIGLMSCRRVGAGPVSVRPAGVESHDESGSDGSGCMAALPKSGELDALAALSAEAMACAMASSTGVRACASPPSTAAGRGSCSSCAIR